MNASIASIDEAARRQYELAWRHGRPESIERFVPSTDHPCYLATVEELVQIEIEMSWKAWANTPATSGDRPQPDLVESYLSRFPELKQPKILHRLIEQEYRARRQAGDTPQPQEYQLRFPAVTLHGSLFQIEEDATLKHVKNPKNTLQIGTQIGRYQLEREHSRGSFGIVWKAEDTMLGRSVALKQLKEYLATKPEYRHRFLAEAKITAQLQHPGIVSIHEVGGEDEGCPYYTMNMVGGETLAEAIEAYHQNKHVSDRTLQWQRLITAYLAVVRTMAFAHNKGVIHRDLKPANVILGQYGETLILDWGLAKSLKQAEGNSKLDEPAIDASPDATQQGSIIGTPAYMSPEQASGKTETISPRSDVYSLGVMLYELLIGKRPFQGDIDVLMRKITQGVKPTPPSQVLRSVPKPLEAICLKAMSFEPANRYEQADLLRADLELYLADEPVAAYVEPWWQRAARWMRRHKALATGMGVTLVLLTIGSVVGYFLYSAAQAARLQEEHDRLQALMASAKTDEDAAQVEITAGRYSSAVPLLDRVTQATQSSPQLAASSQHLVARCDRIRRIAELTRLADLAEQHAAMDRDEVSIKSAERALRLSGIMDHLPDWWLHLPVQDLNADQAMQVREDTSRLLLLLGLERTKLGILGNMDPLTLFRGGNKHFESALELIPAIQNYHAKHWGGPAHSGLIIENFCNYQLKRKDKIHPVSNWTPRGPSDYFFTGIGHFWFGSLATDAIQIENVLPASVAKDIRMLGGFDLQTPLDTGLSMLRMASTLEPRRYWTYNWLGWCLKLRNQPEAAAQAFSSAISIRPDQSISYVERCTTLMTQIHRGRISLNVLPVFLGFSNRLMPGMDHGVASMMEAQASPMVLEAHLKSLRTTMDRIIQGLEMGMKNQDDSDSIYFLHSNCCTYIQQWDKGFNSFAQGVELSLPNRTLAGDNYQDFMSNAATMKALTFYWKNTLQNAMNAERWAVLAMANWRMGQTVPAQEAIAQALKLDLTEPRALMVRGHLAIQANQLAAAAADFQKALEKRPHDFMLHAGLARIAELKKDGGTALEQYRQMSKLATTDWQRAEAGMGEARMLAVAGQLNEAQSVLKRVEEFAPKMAAATVRKLK